MGMLFLAVGIVLMGCAVVAAGMYAWHGQWLPVLLALGGAFIGRMVLGVAEILLTPLSVPMLYLARRGKTALSCIFALLSGLVGRAAFAAYCAIVLLYYMRTPGPPAWLAATLAVVVASAPFAWAAGRASDGAHPSHFDLAAAMLGVAISGTLLVFGVSLIPALAPIAILFLVSVVGCVVWWVAQGAPQVRLEHFMARALQ